MSFHVGQKVVCVDDAPRRGFASWDAPIFNGAIYTIAAIRNSERGLAADLAEVHRPCGLPFFLGRFRPVIERKTDISSIVALLNPTNHKYLEEV